MADEMTMLRSFADDIHQHAPPIGIDEIRQRAAAPRMHFVEVPPRRNRMLAGAGAAVLAVGAIAGLFHLRSISESPGVRPVDTAPAVTNRESSTPQPSTIAPSTAPPSSVAPSTTVASPSEIRAQLDGLEAHRNERLRSLPGIAGVAVVHTTATASGGTPIESVRETTFTLLADGSFWSTTSDGGWGSFDPTTGRSLGAYVGGDGEMHYQLIEGWSENSTGLNILLGGDPTRPIIALETTPNQTAEIELVQSTRDGAAVTEVTTTATLSAPTGDRQTQIETLVVDHETGLIIESTRRQEGDDVLGSTLTVKLTGLTAATSLPDAFPGQFPDGASIERSGDPAAFEPVTMDEAAAWFGPGFVGPPTSRNPTVLLREAPRSDEAGVPYGTRKMVEITIREGFGATTSITIAATRPLPGASLPPGETVVDDMVCWANDTGDACLPGDPDALIVSGPLAGGTSYVQDGSASIMRNGLEVYIGAPDRATVEAAIDSLIAW